MSGKLRDRSDVSVVQRERAACDAHKGPLLQTHMALGEPMQKLACDNPRVRFLNDGAWPSREIEYKPSDPPASLLQQLSLDTGPAVISASTPLMSSNAWVPKWKLRLLQQGGKAQGATDGPNCVERGAGEPAEAAAEPACALPEDVTSRSEEGREASASHSLDSLETCDTSHNVRVAQEWVALLGGNFRESARRVFAASPDGRRNRSDCDRDESESSGPSSNYMAKARKYVEDKMKVGENIYLSPRSWGLHVKKMVGKGLSESCDKVDSALCKTAYLGSKGGWYERGPLRVKTAARFRE